MWILLVLCIMAVKCQVLSLVEGEPEMWVMGHYVNLLLIYALVVESFIDGVVLYMFCFFCRADDPIEISRWVTEM